MASQGLRPAIQDVYKHCWWAMPASFAKERGKWPRGRQGSGRLGHGGARARPGVPAVAQQLAEAQRLLAAAQHLNLPHRIAIW